ncbi:MAG: hypothetical protein ACTSVV_00570 [Promethearchaeota archaeon]
MRRKKTIKAKDFYYRLIDKKYPIKIIRDKYNGNIVIEKDNKNDKINYDGQFINLSISNIPKFTKYFIKYLQM